ncbi:MAG: hypothetical protein KDA24_03835 [Deltaproteobacteria bacterium]|nr:hypothetical protein [Deltaproteobacteria bacterium]
MANAFDDEIRSRMEQGDLLGAIKVYREQTGAGLKTSAAAVMAIAASGSAEPGATAEGSAPVQSGASPWPEPPQAEPAHDLPSPPTEEGMSLGGVVFLGIVVAAITVWLMNGS